LVAFPTETVYGLGADASNPAAVKRIFEAKGRPADHPLIVHLPDAASLGRWATHIPDEARRLAEAFWPGALTMVLEKAPHVPSEATAGLATIGLRVPAQGVALALLRAFGGGVAAPSANRFGRVSPTLARHVVEELGERVDVVIDGGPCTVGVESTIIDMTSRPFQILRPGGVSAERLEAVLGEPVQRQAEGPARAPGMLETHYAPRARVELADDPGPRVRVLLAEGRRVGMISLASAPLPAGVEPLGRAGSPEEYARMLYAWLRAADERGMEVVLAVPPPDRGIGTAVRDRLRRAAATFQGDKPGQTGGDARPDG
jgi:L-threonylcarbamoyladenylate synthase